MGILDEYNSKQEFYEHLRKRAVGDNTRCWIDWNGELVTFPIWTIDGKLIGYQRYDWRAPKVRSNKGRYFTWISEPYRGSASFYGMDQLSWSLSRPKSAQYDSQRILVVEGIFDALRCIQAGWPAIAVLTATPNKQFVQHFKFLMQAKNMCAIGILDNDEGGAGNGLRKLCRSSIMCEWHKDMGDHTDVEAQVWLNTVLGESYE